MKKLLVRLLLSLLIGGGMLYLATRTISFDGTWAALTEARWWLLVPYLGAMVLQHLFRAWRWGHLLAHFEVVPFTRLLPLATVGFFAILALPLRMGELVRPFLVAHPPKLKMSHALGTLAVERVVDGLILALLAFGAVAEARTRVPVPSWLVATGWIALGLFLAALVVLVMTIWQRERAVTLCRRLFGLVSERLAEKAAGVAQGIVEGFRVLPDLRRVLPFLLGTALYWIFNAVAIWVLGLAFRMDLSFAASIGIMGLVGVGIMIPAGPGFVGNFELFADGALQLYLPAAQRKAVGGAFILVNHALNASWYAVAGLAGMLASHVSMARVVEVSVEKQDDAAAPPPAEKMDSDTRPADPGAGVAP
ncbi:MAG: flippase-like domain-containing protein [Deltaproteobacteria bacterium]|nr:flippase-like domain-containing protein [Deltaproteobacteria bacterium]